MDCRITDAAPRHIARLAGIEKACFSSPWTPEQLESQLPDATHVFLVAEDAAGQALGYVGMMFVLDEGYISNVAVAPEHRRRGIGAALIAELLRQAEGLSLAFVTLEVRQSNLPAQALYASFGFAKAGLRKKYYVLPDEDAIIMTKFMK